MTTKKKLLVLIGILVAVAAGVAWFSVWPSRSAINAENAAKIQVGMDLATVEALLGGPARDESTGALVADEPDPPGLVPGIELGPNDWLVDEFEVQYLADGQDPKSLPVRMVWRTDALMVRVDVDSHGRVVSHGSLAVRRREHESPLAAVRRWLRL